MTPEDERYLALEARVERLERFVLSTMLDGPTASVQSPVSLQEPAEGAQGVQSSGPATSNLSFQQALSLLKSGTHIRREVWPEDQYLDKDMQHLPYFTIRTKHGIPLPWGDPRVHQADLAATDWTVVK